MMKTQMKHKHLLTILAIFLAGSLIFALNNIKAEGYAESVNPVLDAAYYTEEDNLIGNNGQKLNKDIFEFANELKSKDDSERIDNLQQIVPVEYLRVSDESKQFYYMGREYGFFVRHRILDPWGIRYGLDLFIIDFEYVTDKNTGTNYIELRPILNETFWYNPQNGKDYWNHATEMIRGPYSVQISPEKEYYIANPIITTAVLNENQKNYGDYGYQKQNDGGNVILQGRINYDAVQLHGADISPIISMGVDYIIGAIPYVGSIYSGIKDVYEAITEIRSGLKTNVSANDEDLALFQNNSKEVQKQSSDPYTRVMQLSMNQSFLLSANNGSVDDGNYLKGITLLDDTNSYIRLIQSCAFDIVSYYGSSETCYNNLDEEGNRIPFVCSREETLFEEFGYQNYTLNNTVSAYFLPNGSNQYLFTAPFTGDYTLKSEQAFADFSVKEAETTVFSANNTKSAVVPLTEGKQYLICYSLADKQAFGQFPFEITFPQLTLNEIKNGNIINGQKSAFTLTAPQDGVYRFDIGTENVTSYIIKENGTQTDPVIGKDLYCYLRKAEKCTLVITGNADTAYRLQFLNVDSLSLNTEKTVTVNHSVYYYSYCNTTSQTQTLLVTASSAQGTVSHSWTVIDSRGDTVSAFLFSNYGGAKFSVDPNQTVYIGLNNSAGRTTYDILLKEEENAVQWYVNGQLLAGNRLYMVRRQMVMLSFRFGNVEGMPACFENNVFALEGQALTVLNNALLGDENYVFPADLPAQYSLIVKVIWEGAFPDGLKEDKTISSNTSGAVWLKWSYNKIKEMQLTFTYNGISKSSVVEGLYGKTEFYLIQNIGSDEYNFYNFYYEKFNTYFGGSCTVKIDWVKIHSSEAVGNEDYIVYNGTNELNCSTYSYCPFFEGGTGTKSNPFKIKNLAQFYNIQYGMAKNYCLDGMISGATSGKYAWKPFSGTFSGTLDGAGNSITSILLRMNVYKCGLFSVNSGTIKNMELGDFANTTYPLSPQEFHMGIIAGENKGTIQDIKVHYSTFTVLNYNSQVGFIVGKNNGGKIDSCLVYNDCELTGSGSIGSIAGRNQSLGTIINCQAAAEITYIWEEQDRFVGGIVGLDDLSYVQNNHFNGKITWHSNVDAGIKPSIGFIVGHYKVKEGELEGNTIKTTRFQNNSIYGATDDIIAKKKQFIIVIWDQSDRIEKVQSKQIGWAEV